MAAPPEITTKNLTGTFTMNKTLSDDTDEVLTLQGIGWFLRKAIGMATITLYVKHYKDDDGLEHIDIDQTLTGGVQGTTEIRILNWTDREHEDHIFGKLVGKSRRIKPSEIDDEYLRTGFLPEVETDSAIESFVVSNDYKWTARQLWGFEEIDGSRHYVRHLKFKKYTSMENLEDPGNLVKAIDRKLVYDYVGQ